MRRFFLFASAVVLFLGVAAAPAMAAVVRVCEGKLNVNIASSADFTRLPGVGEITAFRIVKEREKRGKFKDLADLRKVKGLSARLYEGILPYLSLEGKSDLRVYMDVNTVTFPLLLGIPGMTEAEARSILNHRKKNGKYGSLDDLLLVPGIDEKRLSELGEWLSVAASE